MNRLCYTEKSSRRIGKAAGTAGRGGSVCRGDRREIMQEQKDTSRWDAFFQFFQGLSIPVSRVAWPIAPGTFPDRDLRRTLLGDRLTWAAGVPALPNPFAPDLCIYFLLDRYLCNYVILPDPDGSDVIVVGPFLYDAPVRPRMRELARKLQIQPRMQTWFFQYMGTLTIVYNRAVAENYIRASLPQIYGGQADAVRMDYLQEQTAMPLLDMPTAVGEDYKENFMEMELRYRTEDAMCGYIERGDALRAQKELVQLERAGIPSRSENPLRDARNFLHIFHTLCRRSAYRGQVHPFYIHEMSEQFYQLIVHADSIDEMRKIRSDMLQQYCLLVRQFSTENVRPLIQDVINFILANYTENISLEQIAEEFQVNKSYLAKTFKKETQTTVVDYINRKRVEYACYLIRTQNIPLGDVALSCGFGSLNYFSRMFRRYQNMSPSEYVAMMRS